MTCRELGMGRGEEEEEEEAEAVGMRCCELGMGMWVGYLPHRGRGTCVFLSTPRLV